MKDKPIVITEEVEKKQIKGYSLNVSPVDTLLWQRLDLIIELDENRVPKIVEHKWGEHDSKNMVIQSIENDIVSDIIKGHYR